MSYNNTLGPTEKTGQKSETLYLYYFLLRTAPHAAEPVTATHKNQIHTPPANTASGA